MSFSKKTWTSETPITPDELNRVETGIKDNETNIGKKQDKIGMTFKSDTIVITGNGTNSYCLLNTNKLKEYFGASFNPVNLNAIVINGDYNANQAIITGSYIKESALYIVFNVNVSTGIRVNYTLIYKG